MRDDRFKPDGIMFWLRSLAADGTALRAGDLKCARWDTSALSKALYYLTLHGDLHQAKLGFKQVYYLHTQQAADEYVRTHQAEYLQRMAAERAARPAPPPRDRSSRKGRARPQAAPRAPAPGALGLVATGPLPPITYCPSPTTGPLSGKCAPDRVLVLRPGALDYRRHMTRFQQPDAQP